MQKVGTVWPGCGLDGVWLLELSERLGFMVSFSLQGLGGKWVSLAVQYGVLMGLFLIENLFWLEFCLILILSVACTFFKNEWYGQYLHSFV